jgi:hypothetical protein
LNAVLESHSVDVSSHQPSFSSFFQPSKHPSLKIRGQQSYNAFRAGIYIHSSKRKLFRKCSKTRISVPRRRLRRNSVIEVSRIHTTSSTLHVWSRYGQVAFRAGLYKKSRCGSCAQWSCLHDGGYGGDTGIESRVCTVRGI